MLPSQAACRRRGLLRRVAAAQAVLAASELQFFMSEPDTCAHTHPPPRPSTQTPLSSRCNSPCVKWHTFVLETGVGTGLRSRQVARLRQHEGGEVILRPGSPPDDLDGHSGHAMARSTAGLKARGLPTAVCKHHNGHVLSRRQMPAQASADGAAWTHVYLGPSPVRDGDPGPDRCPGWEEGSKQRRTLLTSWSTWHVQAQALARRMTQAHPEPASSPVSGRSAAWCPRYPVLNICTSTVQRRNTCPSDCRRLLVGA